MKIDQGTDLFERLRFGPEEFIPVAALKNNDDLAQKIGKQQMPIVAYPRNLFLGEALEKVIAKARETGLNFFTVAETGLGPAALEFVREGLGIGWLPHSLIEDELKSGEFTAMTDVVPSFRLIAVAIKSKSSRSKVVVKNWKALQECYAPQDE
jgi:DNA-binding transcriptional LysR family regulator